jgi:phage terminase large subunit-like protein
MEYPTLTQIRAEDCRRNFATFVQEFWPFPEPPTWGEHMTVICNELQLIGRAAIRREKPIDPYWMLNIPPGMSKSTIVSILFPAWIWANDSSIVYITASYNGDLAKKQSKESRDIIVSLKYMQYFPMTKLRGTSEENYLTTLGGRRITTSPGSKAQGYHAHIIILDDPQSNEDAYSEAHRTSTQRWFDSTFPTRMKTPGGTPILIVQQRLHPKDLTAYIEGKGVKYRKICLPAELNEVVSPKELSSIYTDGLLEPVRLHSGVLAERRLSMGARDYESQMNQNPSGDEFSIIKREWLDIMPRSVFDTLIRNNPSTIDFFFDTAYTEKAKNDPSAVVGCTLINGILYITSVGEVRYEFPELMKYVRSFTMQNGGTSKSIVKVEPKASGKSLVQAMRNEHINIVEDDAPTGSKLERLNAIAPKVEALKVVLVEGQWNDAFLHQVTQNDPPHDDMRDAFIMAVRNKLIKRQNDGFSTRLGFA